MQPLQHCKSGETHPIQHWCFAAVCGRGLQEGMTGLALGAVPQAEMLPVQDALVLMQQAVRKGELQQVGPLVSLQGMWFLWLAVVCSSASLSAVHFKCSMTVSS